MVVERNSDMLAWNFHSIVLFCFYVLLLLLLFSLSFLLLFSPFIFEDGYTCDPAVRI